MDSFQQKIEKEYNYCQSILESLFKMDRHDLTEKLKSISSDIPDHMFDAEVVIYHINRNGIPHRIKLCFYDELNIDINGVWLTYEHSNNPKCIMSFHTHFKL